MEHLGKYGEITEEFLGNCVGVRIQNRSEHDLHQSITLLIEDDGNWHETTFHISSFWLKETIAQLKTAEKYLKKYCKKTRWGYERKKWKKD